MRNSEVGATLLPRISVGKKNDPRTQIRTNYIHPRHFGSVIRALALGLKGLRFDSRSKACTSVAGLIPGPGQSVGGRRPINVIAG